jgi:hypothetical protein
MTSISDGTRKILPLRVQHLNTSVTGTVQQRALDASRTGVHLDEWRLFRTGRNAPAQRDATTLVGGSYWRVDAWFDVKAR